MKRRLTGGGHHPPPHATSSARRGVALREKGETGGVTGVQGQLRGEGGIDSGRSEQGGPNGCALVC